MLLLVGLPATAVRAQPVRYLVKLTAYDRLTRPGEAVTVRAKLEHEGFAGINPDMKGYPLRFTGPGGLDRTAWTDKEGVASILVRPATNTSEVIPIQIQFPGSHRHYPTKVLARVFVWRPERPVVVVDIDHTLSDLREFDVLITENARIPALPGAAKSMGMLARRYSIVYLTARDEALYNKTRLWLKDREFPPGPLFTRDFHPWESRESFKRRFISALKLNFPKVVAGVGDRPDDARAYLENGLQAVVINPSGEGRFPERAEVVMSWQDVCDTLMPEDENTNALRSERGEVPKRVVRRRARAGENGENRDFGR